MESGQRTDEATTATTAPSEPPAAAQSVAGNRVSGATSPEVDALRCDLLMNARYHSSREAFLDTLHRVLMFLIIVLGAAAIADLVGSDAHLARGAFAALTVIFASIDLTADLSNRARSHALMKRRYFELLADLTSGQKSARDVEAQMHRCSADEEPAFHALLATSWNAAQEMVYGKYADAYEIPLPHRALKNWFRFGRKYDVIQGSRPVASAVVG